MRTRISQRKQGVFKPEPEIAEKERLRSSFEIKEVAEDNCAPASAPTVAPEAPKATKTYPESPPSLDARYEILDYLGAGGMGSVWKVLDKTLNETFAIKVLHPQYAANEDSIKRIKQEARLAVDLTHANIAAIFGAIEDAQGHPCIVMRYVEGESLQTILAREGKLDPQRAEQIYNQIVDALVHSHMKGIVHRDIKPSNIIISRTESGGEVVKLVDFGIAKSVYEEVSKTQALTRTADIMGSPRYMSPEQFLGQDVGPSADLYSLGCVYYEMLVGHPPFTEENPVKLILQHLHDLPDFSKLPKQRVFEISLLLQKDPQKRKRVTDSMRRFAWIPRGLSVHSFDSFKSNALMALYTSFLACFICLSMEFSFSISPFSLCFAQWLGIGMILGLPIFYFSYYPGKLHITNEQQRLIGPALIIITLFCFKLLLAAFFGPICSYPNFLLCSLINLLAPFLVTFFCVAIPRLQILFKIVTAPVLAMAAIALSTTPFCLYPIDSNYLYSDYISIQKASFDKQALMESALKLPHTLKDDNTRMASLYYHSYDNNYSLETYRSVCQQIIDNKSNGSPVIKLRACELLASTYSGNSENSMQLWKQTTTKTISLLRECIDQPLPTFPYVSAVMNRTKLIDTIQEVAQDCLDHRQPDLADNVMQMYKDQWKYIDGAQMQRYSELCKRLNSQRYEKSE